jgi:hypothetical protein
MPAPSPDPHPRRGFRCPRYAPDRAEGREDQPRKPATLAKPITSCKLGKPASLRSDPRWDSSGIPIGFPAESLIAFSGIRSWPSERSTTFPQTLGCSLAGSPVSLDASPKVAAPSNAARVVMTRTGIRFITSDNRPFLTKASMNPGS